MFSISPQWVLKQLGLDGVDPELTELIALFVMRFQAASDKNDFVKESLRRALLWTAGPIQHGEPARRQLSKRKP